MSTVRMNLVALRRFVVVPCRPGRAWFSVEVVSSPIPSFSFRSHLWIPSGRFSRCPGRAWFSVEIVLPWACAVSLAWCFYSRLRYVPPACVRSRSERACFPWRRARALVVGGTRGMSPDVECKGARKGGVSSLPDVLSYPRTREHDPSASAVRRRARRLWICADTLTRTFHLGYT